MEDTVLKEIAKVDDPETRAKLVPDHMWGCKRPLFANTYYPAFNSPNRSRTSCTSSSARSSSP